MTQTLTRQSEAAARDAQTLADAIATLVAGYHAATEAERQAGRAWYDEARATGLNPGVIAALSPMTTWSVNVAWSRTMVAAAAAGAPCPAVQTTGQRAKAWAIANGAAPLDVLTGVKERAFYRNIVGDPDVVTVDRWAARAAGHAIDRVPAWLFRVLTDAYVAAAGIVGETPANLQAILWVAARGSAA